MDSVPVVLTILCLASVVLAFALVLMLTRYRGSGERYTDAPLPRPLPRPRPQPQPQPPLGLQWRLPELPSPRDLQLPWVEADTGQTPSDLVTNIVVDLLRVQVTEVLPPSVRLERAWTRQDGSRAWQVRVCRIDICDVDFGTRCERVVVSTGASAGASGVSTGAWRVVSRVPISSVNGGPSSDALLLPGLPGFHA